MLMGLTLIETVKLSIAGFILFLAVTLIEVIVKREALSQSVTRGTPKQNWKLVLTSSS